jgi:hypothetical protein
MVQTDMRFMRCPPEVGEEEDGKEEEEDGNNNEAEEDNTVLHRLIVRSCMKDKTTTYDLTQQWCQDAHTVNFRLSFGHEAFKDTLGSDECRGTVVAAGVGIVLCHCLQPYLFHPLCVM